MQISEHTTAGRSGIKPGNPLSISPLEPRNTKLMVAKVIKNYTCLKSNTVSKQNHNLPRLQYLLKIFKICQIPNGCKQPLNLNSYATKPMDQKRKLLPNPERQDLMHH